MRSSACSGTSERTRSDAPQSNSDSGPIPNERRYYAERALEDGLQAAEFTLLDKSSRAVPVRNTVQQLELNGEVYIVSAFVDLTERRRHEAALSASEAQLRRVERQLQHAQKMEAVGRLAAGVAHDFNNVLSVITMCSDILQEEWSADHAAAAEVSDIRTAAERAVRLTRQLLAFSRQQVLDPRVLDINELLTDLRKMLQRLIGEDVELLTELSSGLGMVRADAGQLEQVVINLAVNGRDAMPDGGTLTIATSVSSGPRDFPSDQPRTEDWVLITVQDTGTGMDEQTQTRMFEPFFTTKDAGKGTGLGLSTVYGIVRQSGGVIELSSELGVGTTFRVYLPCVELPAQPRKSSAPTDLRGGTETVLLVEDDVDVRKVALRIMNRLGYRVLEAANPAVALQLEQEHSGPLDLLLTDLVMPGGSGVSLAAKLLERRPGLPVLYMSGYTDVSATRQGVLKPGTAYIQKPFSSALLGQKLRSVLDARAR